MRNAIKHLSGGVSRLAISLGELGDHFGRMNINTNRMGLCIMFMS